VQHVMKVYLGSGGIAPLLLNLGIRWRLLQVNDPAALSLVSGAHPASYPMGEPDH
jgi:hypothetical protein